MALLSLTRAATVYQIPDTIVSKPTCDSSMPDVSNEIYEWLKKVPNGSIALLGENRCYRTESEIPILSRSDFTLDGNGSKLQAFTDGCDSQSDDGIFNNDCKYIQTYPSCHPAGDKCARPNWPQARRRIDVQNSVNLTIKNIKLDGGHPNPGADGTYSGKLAFQHGISFNDNNNNVLVENIEIDRVWGDYIYIGGSNEKKITIQNNKFGEMAGSTKHGTGRQGIAMVSGEDIVIKNNRILEVRRTVIDIEPLSSKAVIRNIYFDDNYIGNHGLNFFSNRNYGKASPVIENVYFRNNLHDANRFAVDTIGDGTGVDMNNPATFKHRNFQFINNRTTGVDGTRNCQNPGSYWKIWGVAGLIIKGNSGRVPANRCMHVVDVSRSRDVSITGNSFLNATATGISYESSRNVCERDNYIGSPLKLETLRPGLAQCAPDEPPPPVDSTPPSKPAGLSNTIEGEKTVKLSWQASTDDQKLAQYRIYRKPAFTTTFTLIGTATNPNYTDNATLQGRTYIYQVSALDTSGNESVRSDTIAVAIDAYPTYDDADINEDGNIDALDFSLLINKFGQTASAGRADINRDGKVSAIDFSILVGRFGQ